MLPILESPGELLKIPMPKPCPVPIKSECLGMEARHQKSVKISRWFQYATIFGNQSHEYQVTGLGVFTCMILFLILLTTLQVKCYCYFFFFNLCILHMRNSGWSKWLKITQLFRIKIEGCLTPINAPSTTPCSLTNIS